MRTLSSILSPLTRLFALTGFAACTLALSISAQAQLPSELQTVLTKANLTPEDISLVIVPVRKLAAGETVAQSRLPAAVVLEKEAPSVLTEDNGQTSSTDSSFTATTALPNPKVSSNKATPASDPVIITTEIPTDSATVNNKINANSKISVNSKPNATTSTTPTGVTSDTLPKDSAASQPPVALPTPLTSAVYHLSDTARTPASTMKLIPTFIALDQLGSDFAWVNRVYYSGMRIGETLYGDIIIQGSGDPKLTKERLEQLLARVQQAGIRHIQGNIIVDTSVFHNVSKDPAAFDNDPLRPYNASPDGFLVNFSTLEIHSFPDDMGSANLQYAPRLADYTLPPAITTRPGACSSPRYSLSPQWRPNGLDFASAMPTNCGERTFYVAYPDAKDFAKRAVKQMWGQLGNTLSGDVISQESPVNRKGVSVLPLLSYPSASLRDIVHDINHHSNNVMTEQVTLTLPLFAQNKQKTVTTANEQLGHSLYYQQPKSDYPAALMTIEQWWRSHLTTPPPVMTNGSGLCRTCTVTAANLAELLQYAYTHPEFAAYVDSLGIAGISGTIEAHKERLPNSHAIGRAWIKTGTLNNVTSMAGYVKGLSGEDYVVVGIINKAEALNTYEARHVLDTMLDWTAQH
ncbi:D-alanyl-D-alanine carboxypeptidase/D-alanyl-D-alanine-endopeptidase [Psychrobacter arenosus]|uniref:D-alanyl-D-alanine carboxypeptidase/D-alanyl-D-alanine endopeptidase n=1 Tax=Psychrobacter arenosus TaxID=256326 RepID=UPI00191A47DE|nr:D-alanyl-D-alanine carboxypeptidase/D-alanyl-D-alanine-endopeptidase [Psychrobacter arenosus]